VDECTFWPIAAAEVDAHLVAVRTGQVFVVPALRQHPNSRHYADVHIIGHRRHPEEGQRPDEPDREDHIGDVRQLHGPGRLVFHRGDVRIDCSPMEAERHNIRDRRYYGERHWGHGQHQRQPVHRHLGRTAATVQGRLASKYTNSTHILKVGGGNLHIYNVSSDCLGLINTGDPAVFIGSCTIKPAQTITGS
jgi:hypothetical protein